MLQQSMCVAEVPLEWHRLSNGGRPDSVADPADGFCTRFRCKRYRKLKADLCIARLRLLRGIT